MPSGRPPIGAPVLGRFTKWGEGRHWEWVGRYLGADEHGDWWVAPPGTRCVRPGRDFIEEVGWVSVAPVGRGWAASFYPDPKHISVYVDMTTPAVWQRRAGTGEHGDEGPEWEVTMVDLDLDVVLTREGLLFVDDEDEFAEHQVSLGYPPEVVALAEDAARTVLAAVAEGREPFATVGDAWLRRVASDAWGGSERT